ncbi:unnamed protein product [Arabidopsis lyrata]|uniref:Predicted protein n=1 Tax=Arabidopsis lyrata subsp. lyrata TaxID=81972 RepID=D7LS32_ARALL|nr:predicted protein [Arabidopsis lyrata subsp. lyrata]CAH8267943.1 unnamed protein product [Arabidopsis lyrata]
MADELWDEVYTNSRLSLIARPLNPSASDSSFIFIKSMEPSYKSSWKSCR